MTHKLRMQIAEEFDQPFADVIKGFADDGYSIGGTARILEYPETSFRTYVNAKGWACWFWVDPGHCKNKLDALRNREMTDKWRESCQRNAQKKAHQITYNGVTDSLAGHCRRLGINRRTVRGRLERRPGDYDYAFSPGYHENPRMTGKGKPQCRN